MMPYLGIELDSVEIEACLPLDKLSKEKHLVLKWLSKRPGKKRKLLSLIGYLQHFCKAPSGFSSATPRVINRDC